MLILRNFSCTAFQFLLATTLVVAEPNSDLLTSFENYSKWQKAIPTEFAKAPHYYLYLSGKNYSENAWKSAIDESPNVFLYKKVVLVSSESLGHIVYTETSTPSGDWFIVEEDYYNKLKSLVFVTWNLNTFQADVPVSVTRTFSIADGKILRMEKKVTEMNSDKPTEAGYADREVQLVFDLDKAEFLKDSQVKVP